MTTKLNNYLYLKLIIFLFLIATNSTIAQIREDKTPILFETDFPIETMHIHADHSTETQRNKNEFPLLIGYTKKISINPSITGTWMIFDTLKTKIWRIQLSFAASSRCVLYFDTFNPGETGNFFAFSKDRKQLIGAFTNQSKGRQSEFAFETMESDNIILQFETSSQSNDYQINISEIGIISPSDLKTGFGSSGDCEVNVNCSEGDAWKHIKQGVARVLVKKGGAIFYCSGTLVNNALRDFKPYFLTANHCGDGASESDYNQWIFDFDYESQDCQNPSTEPESQSIVGASLLALGATYSGSDFKLVQLNQSIPSSFLPFFNGWTTDEQISNNGSCIHHPQGDIKKISTYTQKPVSSDYDQTVENPNGNYWQTYWSETSNGFGVTEGGSSGSPLFDSNGRIIGSLTGGRSDCSSTDAMDYYGKFSKSWSSNGTQAYNQLQPWLDPENTGITSLPGMGVNEEILVADFAADFSEITIGQQINFENLSFGRITNYQWTFEGGSSVSSNEMNPSNIQYNSSGNFSVKLVVSNESTADTMERIGYIQVRPFLYPNPSNGTVTINFGTEIPLDVQIQLFDLMGREITVDKNISGAKFNIVFDPDKYGFFILSIQTGTTKKNIKLLIRR